MIKKMGINNLDEERVNFWGLTTRVFGTKLLQVQTDVNQHHMTCLCLICLLFNVRSQMT